MDHVIGVGLIIMFVSACSLFESEDETRVRYLLKDPSSAEFRNQRTGEFSEADNEKVYCGEVNSKNSFGAMVGFTQYVVIGNAVLVGSESGVFASGEKSRDEIERKIDNFSARLTIEKFESEARINAANLQLMALNLIPHNKYLSAESIPTTALAVAWKKFCSH
ncbi:hypothetical protein [Azoarcus sp. DN11]|uniref:hypothetical protein n=1 Tax=Azoarcus sp. DN11 TaxID=356837 RepID=UPI000FE18EBD|nr:hypothetical protein [Azoarcus sp. DN11]